jgi:hypothetical protein
MIVFMALFIFMLEWREQKREIRNLDSSERHKLSNMYHQPTARKLRSQ